MRKIMRSPNYSVVLSEKSPKTEKKFYHRVGAAWDNENGSISIKLNPGTVISRELLKECTLVLYPTVREHERSVEDYFGSPIDDIR